MNLAYLKLQKHTNHVGNFQISPRRGSEEDHPTNRTNLDVKDCAAPGSSRSIGGDRREKGVAFPWSQHGSSSSEERWKSFLGIRPGSGDAGGRRACRRRQLGPRGAAEEPPKRRSRHPILFSRRRSILLDRLARAGSDWGFGIDSFSGYQFCREVI